MSGVVFIISIPSEKYQLNLAKKIKNKVTFEDNPQEPEEKFQPMEKDLQNILSQLKILTATWCKSTDDNFLQIIFSLDSADRCEEILEILKESQIGTQFRSSVSVLPCIVQYQSQSSGASHNSNCTQHDSDETSAWNRFVSSVRSRLTVAQVVENVKAHAALTFDFVCLILISTTLCAMGLVENNNVTLLSSMLISPMMGPVMAGTFGSVIQDKRLLKIGVQNEIIGLGMATLVGFAYGSLICIITDKYGTQDWPTYEMTSRGELRTLWVGCLIALLSGAAVALGVLSDNIASLVGVAISTSLMPPAVNAGLLWSLAGEHLFKNTATQLASSNYYSNNSSVELLALGAVSMCLTFANIICIYVASILVFKIKEVAPIASKDNARRRFWGHDIKIARDYNKTFQNEDAKTLYKKLAAQCKCNNQLHHSTDLSKDNCKINISTRSEYTWSPCTKFTAKLLNFENVTRPNYRKLSQIFAPPNDNFQLPIIDELSNQEIPECSSYPNEGSRKIFIGKRKFTVTPCESDPLLH